MDWYHSKSIGFFLAGILAALLAGCSNPMTGGAVTGKDEPVGVPDTGSFVVTIAVNPVSGGRAVAELGSGAIKSGGARNTFLLVVLDTKTGKVAGSWEANKEEEGADPVPGSVTLPPGKEYDFLLLMGHRERDYDAEADSGDGKYVYKAGPPTLLAAGFAKKEIKTGSSDAIGITMYPLTVKAEFTSPTSTPSSVEADAEGVELGAADDWTLTWTLGAKVLGQLKAAWEGWDSMQALFRGISGAAWRTGGSYGAFASGARFDYGTGEITLNLGAAPKGAECAAWFNLEYAPFSLGAGKWDGPVWVIRNGINDLPQDTNTDFTLKSGEIQWDSGKNGNGAVCFTLPAPMVTDLNLTPYIPKPVAGATPVYSFAGSQYTGTVTWDPAVAGTFDSKNYTASAVLTAAAGHTFTGIPVSGTSGAFTHNNGTVTHSAGLGNTLSVSIDLLYTDLPYTGTPSNIINIDTVVSGDYEPGWSFDDDVLTIREGGNQYYIKGEADPDAISRRIVVYPGIRATVVLEPGVNLAPSSGAAFDMEGAEVNLILAGSGTTLKSGAGHAGIQAPTGSILTITGYGTLNATGGDNGAGIGGGASAVGGNIAISGGTVTAKGGAEGAGIGGGNNSSSGGNITIGGSATVTATGGAEGAGIGGGNSSSGGNITIGGSATVTATGGALGAGIGGGASAVGGNIAISGGTVNATGGARGSGIGGGASAAGGYITIGGGTVSATGGDYSSGIGGGYKADGGTITIDGRATVNATAAAEGAGIGGGSGGNGGTITINDGTVTATGGDYGGAGIGGGKGSNGGTTVTGGGGGTITISGGKVSATGGDGAGNVSPDGAHQVPGTGTSGGAGIGGGSFGPGGNITISGGFVWAYSPASSSGRPASPSPYDGDTSDINGDPPAIGGGSVSGGSGDAGSITISGGTVIAVTESRGAAIGGGKRATKGSITISGGTIIALYRPGLGAYGYPNIKNYDESNDGTIGLDTDPFGDRGYGHTTTTVSGTPVIFAYGIQDGDRHNRTESKWDIGRTYRPMHVLMTISDEHPTPASGGTIELKSYPTDWNASGPEPPDGNWKEYDLTIPSGATLHIPKGWELIIDGGDDNKSNTLTIASGGKLINDGTITINGTGQANKSDVKLTIASGGELINNGTIRKNGGTFINNGAFNGNAVEQ